MPEAVIRRAVPADAAVLSELGARTFVETFGHLYHADDLRDFLVEAYSLDKTRSDLADPRRAAWLVEEGGEAIGYALAGPCDLPHDQVTPECGELKRIYFIKGRQGGGLGRRLFAEVIAWLQADGPRNVWIGVWSQNHGAQRFYAREGFGTVGEYGFKVGRTVDREFILKRPREAWATAAPHSASSGHNFA